MPYITREIGAGAPSIKEYGFKKSTIASLHEIKHLTVKNNLLSCILVVDDDPITCLISHSCLSDLKIAERVVTISNAIDALGFLKTCTPAMIFIDMMMFEMDGIEFIKELLKQPEIDKVKIVAISAHLNQAYMNKLKAMKIQYILTKPLTEEKIVKVINN